MHFTQIAAIKFENMFVTQESTMGAAPGLDLKTVKALKTFLLVTVISCSTWLPPCTYSFYNYFTVGSSSNPVTDVIVHALGLCTCWINILIYTCRDRSFRKGLIKLFTCYPRNRFVT